MTTSRAPTMNSLVWELSCVGSESLSLRLLKRHYCLTVTIYVYILVPYKRWSSGSQNWERHDWHLSLVLCCHLLLEVWFSLPICRLIIVIKIQNSTELSHSLNEKTDKTLSSSLVDNQKIQEQAMELHLKKPNSFQFIFGMSSVWFTAVPHAVLMQSTLP